MSHNFKNLILLSLLLFLYACPGKPMYKSFTNISEGDTKESVIKEWGEPHRIKRSETDSATREIWIYECLADVDCGDSECYFDAPCYILLFEKNRLVHIHNAT